MLQKALACDGRCGAVMVWNIARGEKAPTKSQMEQQTRDAGWHAPDKLGAHRCSNCRRPDGRRKA